MNRIALLLATIMLIGVLPRVAVAWDGDAVITYHLGEAARARGDKDEAYALFKDACMAVDGVAAACLEWGRMAAARNRPKHVKRALGSAVHLAPDDVEARYRLAVYLLKKGDYTWAAEHLTAALDHATRAANRPIILYYLGYALFKLDQFDDATRRLKSALASDLLPPELRQRCDFYLGLISRQSGERREALASMVAAQRGPSEVWRQAGKSHFNAWSAFPFTPGARGQLTFGTGLNSHPASAFLDDAGADASWVHQLTLRGDAVWLGGSPTDRFRAVLTGLRELVWMDLDTDEASADGDVDAAPSADFTPGDLNLSLVMLQLGYQKHGWIGSVENLVLAGIDAETQLLDNVPEKQADGDYGPGRFGVYAWAVAAKVWWSVAMHRRSVYDMRAKVELRPNEQSPNRSTVRFRFRVVNTRRFWDRALELRVLAGVRYDRSYRDPAIIKYDRLVPEGELTATWQLPVTGLVLEAGGKLRYNWYLNSQYDEDNSFRSPWQDDVLTSSAENDVHKEAYYRGLTRRDLEWEAMADLSYALLRELRLALDYTFHRRISNIDDDVPPAHFMPTSSRALGYRQHVIELLMRISF